MRPFDLGLLSLLAAEGEAPPGGCESGIQLFPLVLMVAIFYLVALRPQQKERREHAAMIANLKRGDDIITSSGIVGTIADITDPFFVLEISRNVKIKILKSAVAKRHVEPKKEPEKEAKA
ncbi:MAG: preprotein translocase subunit YajC [Deltaproteobacteria bacterium]|nr:preprotein translocase subunit YajC [Deltaproteobacteria bacterium]